MKILQLFGNIVMIALIGCYSMAAVKRNVAWENEHILTTDNIYKSPGKARPYLNRGLFYFNKNRIDDAIREYLIALQLDPDYAYAHNNIGVAYYNRGYLDAAIKELKEAIRLSPDYAEAHYNLGIAYGEKGMTGDAYIEMKEAMELNKDIAEELKYSKP